MSAQTRIIRVVTYNIDADQGQKGNNYTLPQPGLITPYNSSIPYTTANLISGGVLEGIGEEIINGDPAQPIDILALEETTSNSVTITPIVNGLNTFYAHYGMSAGYSNSPYQALNWSTPQSGGGPSALIYNTNTLQLIASVPVDPPGGSGNLGSTYGEYREVVRYEFAPAGVTPTTTNEFYVYVSHYKASSGSSNDKARLGEASIIRSNEYLNLPVNARVLYVGDYNPDDGSGEPGYQTICSNGVPGIANSATGQGQGVDPLNIAWNPYTSAASNIPWGASSNWTGNNPSNLFMMSEKATALEWRDDLQVMTSNVYYDVAGGLQYVQGTYHGFGNNSTTPWGSSVNLSGNTALNDLDPVKTNATGLTAAVLLHDLTTATDHLPVVADYMLILGTTATPPSASFTASPTNGVAPLNVAFTDTSSGSPTSWSWNFGDTGTSTSQSPNHTYTTPGTYSVRLIASNSGGSSTNTQTNLITVLPPPPVASFTATPTNGAAPLTVSFTDASSGSITGWSWAFGDSGTSTSQSPSHQYINPGSYAVQEIVSGTGGSSNDTVVGLINVYAPYAWWQLNYFGSTNDPNGAAGNDSTGTGMSNTNKFLAGFNPTNPAAYLHILNVAVTNTTDMNIFYLGANGDSTYVPGIASRTNVLEYTTGAPDGSYSNDFVSTGQTNILSGGTGVGIVTNMVDAGGASNVPSRYYRIRVLVP
ncbi:MAG TPA: PKD domain-containing protein [Verrucomicrobiae bacterium]|nr:PKD domain-containing protein [Verrucomicrobiae bacterium]